MTGKHGPTVPELQRSRDRMARLASPGGEMDVDYHRLSTHRTMDRPPSGQLDRVAQTAVTAGHGDAVCVGQLSGSLALGLWHDRRSTAAAFAHWRWIFTPVWTLTRLL